MFHLSILNYKWNTNNTVAVLLDVIFAVPARFSREGDWAVVPAAVFAHANGPPFLDFKRDFRVMLAPVAVVVVDPFSVSKWHGLSFQIGWGVYGVVVIQRVNRRQPLIYVVKARAAIDHVG